ncbi:helix-turn-helix domain-containing protein [Iodobacter sp.]|uniref:helix-turn-helix domain-containing protein n=1 Tax=Iodobacter sp. TaxID=1915058 RepID=UPI0025CD4300|nr:XRE family transcriptional regulator [Iodobacter sp.]
MSNIDTKIRHVTQPSANLFAELGFSADDAQRYQAESLAQINSTLKIKEELIIELGSWIKSTQLRQEDVAKKLHISRPRVSDVVNKKTNKFTIDSLVSMLIRAEKPITIKVG